MILCRPIGTTLVLLAANLGSIHVATFSSSKRFIIIVTKLNVY